MQSVWLEMHRALDCFSQGMLIRRSSLDANSAARCLLLMEAEHHEDSLSLPQSTDEIRPDEPAEST